MKTIVMPLYVFDSMLRHFERVVEHGKGTGVLDTKTSEAFRLGRQDIKKLKKIRQNYEQ